MNPTPPQVAAIRAFVAAMAGGWTNADAQVRAAMAATLVANPVTAAPIVPRPFDVDDLIGAATTTTSKQALANLATTIPSFLADVDGRNLPGLRRWARLLITLGKITQAEATAMAAVITTTQADPGWAATIPWDVANLGRTADDFDIETARAGA